MARLRSLVAWTERDRPWLNIGLLCATLVTTFITFLVTFLTGTGLSWAVRICGSALFAVSLLLILGSHEMGHWLLARHHRVDASLPYFIPLPFLGVGTLGAVIRIRGPIPDRNALVDIGAAGPLAGIAVAIPILLWGFSRSHVVAFTPAPSHFVLPDFSLWVLGREFFEWARAYLLDLPRGAAHASAVAAMPVFGDSLLMEGLRWVVFGTLPKGKEVAVDPIVIAGWFGILVTMINLVPIGQLDGGHLAFALFGRHARTVGKVMAWVLLGLTVFASVAWLVWLVVAAKLIGFNHPKVEDETPPLGAGRKWICALSLLVLVVCVMPVPMSMA